MAELPYGLAGDPRDGDPQLREYFADSFPRVHRFALLLADQGVTRGLIGPRELERIWERHILNSAAVVPYLGHGSVADVGSGAGLPGVVAAAMLPTKQVYLIEPMERRVTWLTEAVAACGIDNVTVIRARAEECHGTVVADAVTARAVASVDKLVKWCGPLVSDSGHMAFLKGRSVHEELDKAKHVLRKHGWVSEVHLAPTIDSVEPTTVVTLKRSP